MGSTTLNLEQTRYIGKQKGHTWEIKENELLMLLTSGIISKVDKFSTENLED